MTTSRLIVCTALAVILSTFCVVTPAQQPFPAKPIRFITSSTAGALIDLLGRIAGNAAQERLGQNFLYENRPGANTILAVDACAKAPPNGYTLCTITNSNSTNAYLYPKIPFDHLKDLDPVTLLAIPYEGLVMDGSLPVKNLKDLIDYSRANPGKLNYGSLGAGGLPHLVPEWLNKNAGASFVHIPYKGAPELLRAFQVGDIQLIYLSLGSPPMREMMATGKMRVLFVPGEKRYPILPNVPTMSEAGVPDHGTHAWWGLAVPAGTPKEIVDTLSRAFAEALQTPAVRDRLVPFGVQLVGNTPEEFRRFILADQPKAERLVKASGARLE